MELRDYQSSLYSRMASDLAGGAQNVLGVLPTGGGKSAIIAHATEQYDGYMCLMAHRDVLVLQLSLALARFGVRHGVIASQETLREITRLHMEVTGSCFFDARSTKCVASVDTLRNLPPDHHFAKRVSRWIVDEAQHLTREGGTAGKPGKWMQCLNLFRPDATGMGFTAAPTRADGKGLGRQADGVMDSMVLGPTPRELMALGYLADYDYYMPPTSDLDLSGISTTATGDLSPKALSSAVHKSKQLVGNIVSHYLTHCYGMNGVVFATDVLAAEETCAEFEANGIPARVITGATPSITRARVLKQLEQKEILQVVSVDVLSEGTDVPGIEYVGMARPTESLSLYLQQVGRGLRPKPGGKCAQLFDHVGNLARHGPPDRYRTWSLDSREKSSKKGTDPDVIPFRSCPQCTRPYERSLVACPFCGFEPQPAARGGPELVDGDLCLVDPAVLERLRGEANKQLVVPYGAPPEVVGAVKKRYAQRCEARDSLLLVMDVWGGLKTSQGKSHREQQKEFYLRFGIDVLTAQTLPPKEANALKEKIACSLS